MPFNCEGSVSSFFSFVYLTSCRWDCIHPLLNNVAGLQWGRRRNLSRFGICALIYVLFGYTLKTAHRKDNIYRVVMPFQSAALHDCSYLARGGAVCNLRSTFLIVSCSSPTLLWSRTTSRSSDDVLRNPPETVLREVWWTTGTGVFGVVFPLLVVLTVVMETGSNRLRQRQPPLTLGVRQGRKILSLATLG